MDNQTDVNNTIASMFSDVLNIALTESDVEGEAVCDVSGCVHIWGSHDLVLVLDANAALAQRSAMALLETDVPLDAEDIPETFAELINIVAGNLTGMLETAHFSRPVVSSGATIRVPNARRTMRGVFSDDVGGILTYTVYPGISLRGD